jgi:hypothetical protein
VVFPSHMGFFLSRGRLTLFIPTACARGPGCPLAPHKALKSGALSSPSEVDRVAQWVATAGATLQHGAASVHTIEVAQVT